MYAGDEFYGDEITSGEGFDDFDTQIQSDEFSEDEEDEDFEEDGDGMTDAEADADTLRNIGWGTDEDYGYANDGYDEW